MNVTDIGGIKVPEVNVLDLAVIETEYLHKGEHFLVKDLFNGYEWNQITRSDRLLFGTLFLNYVKTHPNKIKAIEKNFFWSAEIYH